MCIIFLYVTLVLNKKFLEVRKKQVYSELLDIIRLERTELQHKTHELKDLLHALTCFLMGDSKSFLTNVCRLHY